MSKISSKGAWPFHLFSLFFTRCCLFKRERTKRIISATPNIPPSFLPQTIPSSFPPQTFLPPSPHTKHSSLYPPTPNIPPSIPPRQTFLPPSPHAKHSSLLPPTNVSVLIMQQLLERFTSLGTRYIWVDLHLMAGSDQLTLLTAFF